MANKQELSDKLGEAEILKKPSSRMSRAVSYLARTYQDALANSARYGFDSFHPYM